jgi:hypothetical protein
VSPDHDTGKEWRELRVHIERRLDDLSRLERDFVELRIQFTEVKTKVISMSVAITAIGSAAVSWFFGGR